MWHMLVRHRVAEFEAWRRVFAGHAAAQRDAGLALAHVWRSQDDPQEVFLLFEVANLERARAFVTSPAVPGAQLASGVRDKPDIWFLAGA
jgi:hypothetical protein